MKKQFGAIRSHSTATDDSSSWDASAATGNINQTAANYKQMYAYQDPDGNPDAKGTYSFPHHNANSDGSVGAANTSGASAGIAALNGGRGGHNLSTDDKVGVYNHLAKHLTDAGKEAPELKGAGSGQTTMRTRQFAVSEDDIAAAVAQAMNVDPSAVEVDMEDDGSIEVETTIPDGTCETEHTVADDGTVTSTGDDGSPIAANTPEATQAAAVEDLLKSNSTSTTTAAAPPVDVQNDNSFSMPVMVIEGEWTGDGRFIVPGALTWRDLPLPTMALKTTTMDHTTAELVGRLDSIDRRATTADDFNSHTQGSYNPDSNIIHAAGIFDTGDQASEIQRLVSNQFLRGVSVDIGDAVSELVYLDINGNEVEGDDPVDFWDLLFGFTADGEEEPEPGQAYSIGEKIMSGRVMGATICPFPAFEGAFIQVGGALAASGKTIMGVEVGYDGPRMPSINIVDKFGERKVKGFVAAGDLAAPMVPPRHWFEDPHMDGPTALTISETGEICGHLALWTECHMSYQNQCVNAPHSMTDYAYFRTGCVLTDNDELVPTGCITMNTGHAELWQNSNDAKSHYDNTGSVVADIAAGEDVYGIWVHGSMRPDVDQLTLRRLRGAALSGDWRQIGGNLELVAALAVNVPGFTVKRPAARIASGSPMSLVAAGRVTQSEAFKLRKLPRTPSGGVQYSQGDLDVMANYIKRELRSNVHREVRK